MTAALDPGRWLPTTSRRTFLWVSSSAGLAVLTGLAGCSAPGGPTAPGLQESPDGGAGLPANPGGPDPTHSAAPHQPLPTFPGAVEGAAREEALAAHAAAVLNVGHDPLGKGGRALVTAIRDQHRAHAAALRSSDPTDPGSATGNQPTGTPSPSHGQSGAKPSFATSVDRLLAAESKAAASHRSEAMKSTGLAALLWGSLATSAGAIATIVRAADLAGDDPDPQTASVAAVKPRAPMPVVTIVQAEQEMVRQLHAVIYGYQLALGRLTGKQNATATGELRRHRILRDQLTTRLLNRKAEVPVAEPAYVPTTNPRNARTAAKLVRQMETALVPFCGLWLTATDTPAERSEAIDQVARTERVARQWGASLPTWPGWKTA